MKKMMIAVTALGALLCTTLTGCSINVSDDTVSKAADIAVSMLDDADISVNGQKVDVSVDSNGDINVNVAQTTAATQTAADSLTTAAAIVTEATAAPATEATAAPTTAAAPAGLSEAEMKNISMQLIKEYVTIYDGLGCGCVDVDETQVYDVNPQWPYRMVTDPKLQSVQDVEMMLAKTLTGTAYAQQHAAVLEGDVPRFITVDGKLYVTPAGRGGAYSDAWDWDGLKFTNVTAEGFTVTGQYVHMGIEPYGQSFDIIKTTEGYRICKAGEFTYS